MAILEIAAGCMHFRELNELIKGTDCDVTLSSCFGQRYIAAGLGAKTITITGTPGNALAAYMDGAHVIVHGNVQDAVGDTMNDGRVIVHGNAGDALGYGMRGGAIFVKGRSGYRTGIHMKEYQEKKPVIIVGEKVGSFLGEYMAGGLVAVLGIGMEGEPPVGRFTGTGMHGGKAFIRSDKELTRLPAQVSIEVATKGDLEEIEPHVDEFAKLFGYDKSELLNKNFFVLKPNAKNPYHTLYTPNPR
ncbi:MAG: glutamate synthase [Clostridiales bacterium]|jgi:glutamate synthase domain-containing protein 3|nr:glutamate synthase [Clostridiales bacterium]